jgi:hypothetical protein
VKVSRRDFIHAGCTVGAVVIPLGFLDRTRAETRGTAAPGAPTSRMQVNLYSPFESLEYPFLNFLKMPATTFVTNSLEYSVDQWATMNADGYPQSGAGWNMGADVYFVPGQPLVLDWAGTGLTFVLSSPPAGFTFTEVIANRTKNSREYNVINLSANFGDRVSCQVSIVGSSNSTFKGIRLYYKQYQVRLNSGERFDPYFVARYKNMGRMRFMDWMATNSSQQCLWANRVSDSNISAFGQNVIPANYCGFFTKQAENDWSSAIAPKGWVDGLGKAIVEPVAWTDGQIIQGCAQALAVKAVSRTSPAQLTVPNHGLSTGDVVVGFGMNPGAYKSLQAPMQLTIVDNNNFTVVFLSNGANVDATGFPAFSAFFTNVISIPRSLTVTGFSNHPSAPLVTTGIGHNYAVGDIVSFPGNNTLHGGTFGARTDYNDYTVASVPASPVDAQGRPTTFTIALDGKPVDSTGWGRYSNDGSGRVNKQIRYKAGSLPYKRVISGALETIGDGSFYGAPGALFDNFHFLPFQLTYSATADCLMLSQVGSGSRMGCSYEMLIALANEVNANPWFCIPFYASDDFVTSFAKLVKRDLNPWLTPCFEFSNEVWNFGIGFAQTQASQRLSYLLWPTQARPANGQAIGDYNQYYGMRFYQVMALVDGVYAGSGLPYKRIMGMFTAFYGSGLQDNRYKAPLAVASGRIPAYPILKADSIAIAPYISGEGSGKTGEGIAPPRIIWESHYGSKRVAIQYFVDYSTDDGTPNQFTFKNLKNTIFPGWKKQAAAASGFAGRPITLTMYEGGWGYAPTTGRFDATTYNNQNVTGAMYVQYFWDSYQSEVWADAYAQSYLSDFENPTIGGGEYPSQYATTASWGNSPLTGGGNGGSMWGMFSPNAFAAPIPAWAKIRAF